MSSVSVPVIDDDIVEENETFDVILNIPSSVSRGITLGGRSSATIIITDSTGKYIVIWLLCGYLLMLLFICILSGCENNQ